MVSSLRSRPRKSSRSTATTKESQPPPPPLPVDVLIEILKRLPLKSLVRFTCICKSWFCLLTSPSFNSTVANFKLRESNHTQKFLLFKESIDIHLKSSLTKFTVYDPDTLVKQGEFECPLGRKYFVVCSGDGVVCLFDFYSKNPAAMPLFLWNPSISKAVSVRVPVGGLEFTAGGFPKLIFGFGFDSGADCYKVVRVAYFNGGGGGSNGTTFRTNVYGVSDGEWRNLGVSVVPHNIVTIRWRGVYLNGVIHWVCNLNVNLGIHRLILTMKLGDGGFNVIELPKELVDTPTLRVVVVPRANKEVLGAIHIVNNVLNLWVMEKYAVKESWVKLFSVKFSTSIKNDMNVSVMSDHAVVAENMFGWVYYDHKQQQMHLIRTVRDDLDYVDTYLESLILVGHRTEN